MATSVVEDYLRLGLQIDRHVEGMVDAYFGPPELAAEIAAEPPVEPHVLVDAAEELLADLDDGWLRDQVVGLRTYAGVLAGEPISYADEAEGCYGVRPTRTDEAVFAAAHERLEELLPGPASLAERFQSWESSMRVPAEKVERTVTAAIDTARRLTRDLVGLPDGEGVAVETVRDVAWVVLRVPRRDAEQDPGQRRLAALGARGADGRDPRDVSRPPRRALLEGTAPRPRPGTSRGDDRARADAAVARGRGHREGRAAAPPRRARAAELEAVARDAGVDFDLDHALAVQRAHAPCGWSEVNAALMLHEDGASDADVREYVERWDLVTPEISAHVLRFLREPTSRTYMITYLAGRDLCETYVAGDPDRFRRLLTEQVRVGELTGSSTPAR